MDNSDIHTHSVSEAEVLRMATQFFQEETIKLISTYIYTYKGGEGLLIL
jgi:hypothetical protein